MQMNARFVGAGMAVALAAGIGYSLFFGGDDEIESDTVVRDGAFSVRDYPRLIVAETVAAGSRASALSIGFAALADFLSEIAGGGRVPLAAPVFTDGDDDGRGWRTRCVVPARADVELLAGPDATVRVRALPPRRLAVVRFSGEADDAALDDQEARLRVWMAGQGLRAAGPVEHAFYGTPIVPGALRRSEVLIPLAA